MPNTETIQTITASDEDMAKRIERGEAVVQKRMLPKKVRGMMGSEEFARLVSHTDKEFNKVLTTRAAFMGDDEIRNFLCRRDKQIRKFRTELRPIANIVMKRDRSKDEEMILATMGDVLEGYKQGKFRTDDEAQAAFAAHILPYMMLKKDKDKMLHSENAPEAESGAAEYEDQDRAEGAKEKTPKKAIHVPENEELNHMLRESVKYQDVVAQETDHLFETKSKRVHTAVDTANKKRPRRARAVGRRKAASSNVKSRGQLLRERGIVHRRGSAAPESDQEGDGTASAAGTGATTDTDAEDLSRGLDGVDSEEANRVIQTREAFFMLERAMDENGCAMGRNLPVEQVRLLHRKYTVPPSGERVVAQFTPHIWLPATVIRSHPAKSGLFDVKYNIIQGLEEWAGYDLDVREMFINRGYKPEKPVQGYLHLHNQRDINPTWLRVLDSDLGVTIPLLMDTPRSDGMSASMGHIVDQTRSNMNKFNSRKRSKHDGEYRARRRVFVKGKR